MVTPLVFKDPLVEIAMEAILARRYAFCDFSNIVGFPNPMPNRDEWEGILPTFKGEDWEVLAEHLLDFHDFIHQRQIVHEDVQIKIFKYSLKGATHDWCRSLSASSIISLAGFHVAFNVFCEKTFSAESLFDNCCDEFEKYIQHKADFSSDCKNENHVFKEDLKDNMYGKEISAHNQDQESFVHVDYVQNKQAPDLCLVEILLVRHEDLFIPVETLCEKDDKHVFELTSVVDFHIYDDYENDACHKEIVVKEDFSHLFQEDSYDVFSPVIEEKNQEVACHSLLDPKVLDDLHCDNKIVDTFDIISNVSIVPNVHQNKVNSFESSEGKEHMYETSYGTVGSDQEHYGIDKEKLRQHLYSSDQLVFCHIVYDPVVVYMESLFLEVCNFALLGLKEISTLSISCQCFFCCNNFILFSFIHLPAKKKTILLVN
jgi:hypothetical protein